MRRRTRRHHRPHTRSPLSSLLRAHLSRVASPSPTRNLRRPYRPCTSPPALSPRQGDRRPRDEHRRRRRGLRLLWLEPQPRIGASRRDCAREIFNQGESVPTRRIETRDCPRDWRRAQAGGAAPPACAAADARLFLPAFSNNPDICPRRPLAADLRVDLQSGATRGVPPPRSSRDAARSGRRPRASLSRACPRADPVARCVVPLRAGVRVWRVPAGVLPLSAGAEGVAGARCDCPAPLCYCY